MAVSAETIRRWYEEGVEEGHKWMLIVCDTYDYEDYPVYVSTENYWDKRNSFTNKNMQLVMESYDLEGDQEVQLAEYRNWSFPARD